MRKRLVIGAIAIVVIGVGAYFFWPPRKGSLQYHKAKYLDEKRKESWVKNMGPSTRMLIPVLWANPTKRRAFHERALFEKGYLVTRVVLTEGRGHMTSEIASTISIPGLAWGFISIKADGTNATITAPADLIDQIAEVVRHSKREPCDDK